MQNMTKNRESFRRRFLRKIYYNLILACRHKMPAPSDCFIDVVIPIVEKDLDILPLSLKGIRKNVTNRIKNIYIVAPAKQAIIDFARDNGCKFVDDTTIFGYGAKSLGIKTESGADRSGWLFQQLLKLSGAVGTEEWFITMDADHILLRPHTFVDSRDRHVFYQSAQCHKPYYTALKKLLGDRKLDPLSFVAHKMAFNKSDLKRLRQAIEEHSPKKGSWDRIIAESLDLSSDSPFSEFETYGNFIDRERKICLPWNSAPCHHWKEIPDFEDLEKRYARLYRSVTFPEHKRLPAD